MAQLVQDLQLFLAPAWPLLTTYPSPVISDNLFLPPSVPARASTCISINEDNVDIDLFKENFCSDVLK